jgi:Family of unknown function (DUF6325)
MSDTDLPGPVDFVLIEFEGDRLDERVAASALDLIERGIVTLYDLLLVRKMQDGSFESIEVSALPSETSGAFADLGGARSGLLDDEDVEEMAAALEPGTLGLLLVYENTWARPFVAASYGAGGQLVASQRIPVQEILDTLDALESAE